MTTTAFTPTDIVNFAAKKDAVNLSSAFNDMISQRVVSAIDARKQQVANQMFNGADQELEASAEDEQANGEQAAAEASNETEQEEHSEESDENAQETN